MPESVVDVLAGVVRPEGRGQLFACHAGPVMHGQVGECVQLQPAQGHRVLSVANVDGRMAKDHEADQRRASPFWSVLPGVRRGFGSIALLW